MMEIGLRENLLPLRIGDREFTIDADDLHNHMILDKFIEKYKGTRVIDDTFITECKIVIDELLGENAYQSIFVKDDLKPYYLIIRLAEEMQYQFEKAATTKRMLERQKEMKDELDNVKELVEGFSSFAKQLDYTANKYGMKNGIVNKKRFANKNRNK